MEERKYITYNLSLRGASATTKVCFDLTIIFCNEHYYDLGSFSYFFVENVIKI